MSLKGIVLPDLKSYFNFKTNRLLVKPKFFKDFFIKYLFNIRIFPKGIFLCFSEMYTSNPDEACLFIPSVDSLNFKHHRNIHTFLFVFVF